MDNDIAAALDMYRPKSVEERLTELEDSIVILNIMVPDMINTLNDLTHIVDILRVSKTNAG